MTPTPIQELLSLIPSGQEIKQAISDNDMDEKMLDEWLWGRIYKGKNWNELEQSLILQSHSEGFDAGYSRAMDDFFMDIGWDISNYLTKEQCLNQIKEQFKK